MYDKSLLTKITFRILHGAAEQTGTDNSRGRKHLKEPDSVWLPPDKLAANK